MTGDAILMQRSMGAEPVLPRSFYARPVCGVARDLLGKVIRKGNRSGIIVETEAYLGQGDRAAHSARGITPRTRVLFGPAGHAYVYLIYGIHYCLNISAETDGIAGCVLLRALQPLAGIEISASGPGRLTKALGIDMHDNGKDVTAGSLVIFEPAVQQRFRIETSRRIGITKSADLLLRFSIQSNAHVSR